MNSEFLSDYFILVLKGIFMPFPLEPFSVRNAYKRVLISVDQQMAFGICKQTTKQTTKQTESRQLAGV
jgi:hypothetical protein